MDRKEMKELRELEEKRRKEEEKRKQEIKRNTSGQSGTTTLSASELEWTEADYIGGGSSGKVYKGKCRGNVVAVKIMYDRNGSFSKVWRSFLAEVDMLSKMRHVNICTFLGACEKNGKFAIVSELLSSDMRTFLNEQGAQLSVIVKLKLMLDSALGMSWLYGREQKIIHRDLKLENMLIDVDKMIVKVCDFGLADYAIKEETDPDNPLHGDTGKGNALYKAPELLMEKEYTEKIDVYAFGLALWEVLTGATAFKKFDDLYKAGVPNAWHTFVSAVISGERPPIDSVRKINKELADLVECCWSGQPSKRPSFQDIIHQLCSIILNLSIKNKIGQRLWARFCMHTSSSQLEEIKMSVPIDSLLQEILLESNAELPDNEALAEDELRCMEKLLKHYPRETLPFAENAVQITQFGAFLDSVGPLSHNIFRRVRALVHTPGFYGQVEPTKLKTSLAIAGPGSYLLRFSSNPGSLTLSYVPLVPAAGQDPTTVAIEHRRIDYDGSHYKFSDSPEKFESIPPLLMLPRIKALCFKPCLGSPFVEDDTNVSSKYV
eukprot:TRINITY_DN804_c0_g1_i1.p1 TRINITY_DN804_c0_g1~~TRINITY_DN804_c0_g1_i1.p1  ORF type:complete len:547 (-),score=228.56 TRINITY_DN804_c0_g1_i1:346-1986(-)